MPPPGFEEPDKKGLAPGIIFVRRQTISQKLG